MGYPEWWDHSRDSRKQNSKKASTAAIVETKTEDDSGEKSSTLAVAAGNGGNVTPQTRGSVDYPSTRRILVNVG